MTENERTAILETRVNRNELDVSRLFKFFREHMLQEEKDREIDRNERNENREEISRKVDSINNKLSNQKSFWAGMVFAFTGIGALIGSAIVYLKGGGG